MARKYERILTIQSDIDTVEDETLTRRRIISPKRFILQQRKSVSQRENRRVKSEGTVVHILDMASN
jgi:hypothetical protein